MPDVRSLGLWPRADVLAAWRRSSFAIVPSLWQEPFGIVALEAMAMGKPVIASNIGGLTDLVDDGTSGVLVAPGDVDALRSALSLLTTDTDLRGRMARAAASRVKDFSAASLVPRLESVYEGLLS